MTHTTAGAKKHHSKKCFATLQPARYKEKSPINLENAPGKTPTKTQKKKRPIFTHTRNIHSPMPMLCRKRLEKKLPLTHQTLFNATRNIHTPVPFLALPSKNVSFQKKVHLVTKPYITAPRPQPLHAPPRSTFLEYPDCEQGQHGRKRGSNKGNRGKKRKRTQ